jgi:hypothetical protein
MKKIRVADVVPEIGEEYERATLRALTALEGSGSAGQKAAGLRWACAGVARGVGMSAVRASLADMLQGPAI